MTNEELTSVLNDLIQLDIDAVESYEQSIKRIDIPQIAEDLRGFKGDHERHIENLSKEVRRLGGEPPEQSPDLKGRLQEGFTALRSAMGSEGSLKAMRSNEKMTNRGYDEALSKGLPSDVEAVVRGNREDERRHLEYIEETLNSQPWETRRTTQPIV